MRKYVYMKYKLSLECNIYIGGADRLQKYFLFSGQDTVPLRIFKLYLPRLKWK